MGYITGACIQCDACRNECPTQAINISYDEMYRIDDNICVDCGECVEACPVDAIVGIGSNKYAGYGTVSGGDIMGSALQFEGTPYPSDMYNPQPGEIDCSHLVHQVYQNVGLDYTYQATATFAQDSNFFEISANDAQLGDVMLIRGSSNGHMGIYDPDPPKGGYYIYSATSSKGVRYGRPSWFEGNTNAEWRYFRYNQGGN
jgi:NAD-dependent dihydropyrimidine dehydrogenase PreA subunit